MQHARQLESAFGPSQKVRPSKGSCATALVELLIQGCCFPLAVLFLSSLSLPWTLESLFVFVFTGPLLLIGILGVYHLVEFFYTRRYRDELHFDGETVTSCRYGKESQSFTQADVQAYYPHRNEVLVVDGRRVSLPDCAPCCCSNDLAVASPWIIHWWPELDLPSAIGDAEKRLRGWRYSAYTVKLLGIVVLVVSSSTSLIPADYLLTAMVAIFYVLIFVPDWLERHMRRKVVVDFPYTPFGPVSV